MDVLTKVLLSQRQIAMLKNQRASVVMDLKDKKRKSLEETSSSSSSSSDESYDELVEFDHRKL